MGSQRYCDRCGLMGPSIETFGLRRQIKPEGKPYWTTEGAGSIELCAPCWEKIAKPKMRPWKKNTFEMRAQKREANGDDRRTVPGLSGDSLRHRPGAVLPE